MTGIYETATVVSMNAMKAESPVSMRLPLELIERIDALAERAQHLPEFSVAKPSRSSVLRLAILRGVEQLEQEAKAKRGKK